MAHHKLTQNMNSRTILQNYDGCTGLAILLIASIEELVLNVKDAV
jgi:hypothetical protein